MDLSVVIVNYNVQYFLEQCLASVHKAIDYLRVHNRYDVDVWIVDNNSTDGSLEMIRERFSWVKLIANTKNTGFSFANNQAIRESNSEFVLLLNPDTVVPEDCFEKILNFASKHPEAGGIGVKMIDGSGNYLPESKRGFPSPEVAFYKIFGLSSLFPHSKRFGRYHLGFLNKDEAHKVDVLAGAFMLLRRNTLDKIGLLDEDFFMYGEDIDLSYRIVKGGFANIYYPSTTIIHYKGESTKKSSINYVFVFYRAMVIFAKKHLPKKTAALFSFFINAAIYLRAGTAIILRIAKRMVLPLLDFGFIYFLVFLMVKYWERTVRYHGVYGPDSYPIMLYKFFIPGYIILWIIGLFVSGSYQAPFRLRRILKGIITGTLLIAFIYAFLPENYRFSRAIIILGTAMAFAGALICRWIYVFIKDRRLFFSENETKKIMIIGNDLEYNRVRSLLEKVNMKLNVIGRINPLNQWQSNTADFESELKKSLIIYKPDELIFCNADVDYIFTIKMMETLNQRNLQFKTVPDGSKFVIGSSSKDEPGDFYAFTDQFAINDKDNVLNKRLLDIFAGMCFFLSIPISFWFVKHSAGFIVNIIKVIKGKQSWVGYYDKGENLPTLKEGILDPTDEITAIDLLDFETIRKLDFLYARDYNVYKDISIILKSFSKLGNKKINH